MGRVAVVANPEDFEDWVFLSNSFHELFGNYFYYITYSRFVPAIAV